MAELDLPVLGLMRTCYVIAVLMLAGCALKEPPTHTETVDQALPATTKIPAEWMAGSNAGTVIDSWLKAFNDPALEAIVNEAIANNLDLRQAAQRVRVAQETAVVVGAQLSPWVGASLGARSTRDDDHDTTANSRIGYAAVAWELDVWGELRAQRAAAEAGYQATALEYAYARQSLAATTAKLWYLAIETHQLVALAEQAVQIYSELLTLVEIRRKAGKDSDLDVVDVQARVDTAKSEFERARASDGEVRRALEELLGRYPANEIEVAQAYPVLAPLSGGGVPSALLERRPDILAAERGVLATFRNKEAADLALLPQFTFSLIGGRVDNGVMSHLHLNPWLETAHIGMSIPIYEGGALRAKIEIATAQQAQALARYGAVALAAFREVEDSLANEQLLALQRPLDQAALDGRIEAVRIATIQYKAGRRDLLWVAQLQSAQLSSNAQVIKLGGAQRANRVRLQLALGGSFDAAPAAAAFLPIE